MVITCGMLGEGANNVMASPAQLFLIQFHAIKQFIGKSKYAAAQYQPDKREPRELRLCVFCRVYFFKDLSRSGLKDQLKR